MADNLAIGKGNRKTSNARVFLRNGAGIITVNGKKLEEYFSIEVVQNLVKKPLEITENLGKFDLLINVNGGGYAGQAGACVHGIARALVAYDESNRSTLKANGMLTRDSRMVERKKYGQRGARRKFQFSKR
ncbi:MAG: 30S ribosomal protein S9 [Spirochaetales bacterium]|nr:30S ribosomal protein S9 [Spirochaetales bacterium]